MSIPRSEDHGAQTEVCPPHQGSSNDSNDELLLYHSYNALCFLNGLTYMFVSMNTGIRGSASSVSSA